MWYFIIACIPTLVWCLVFRWIVAKQHPFNYRAATTVTAGVAALILVALSVEMGRLPNRRGMVVFASIWLLGVGLTYWVCRSLSQMYETRQYADHEDDTV
jgi:hypothetical protein